jgi:4-amino-4-deoxy-L-arabinose transferase-like glycosyltransferase
LENPPERRRVWQSLPFITLVALALRLVAVGFLYKDTWNDFRDHLLFGFEIGRIARSLAAGHGYGNPMLMETGPTAWMTPIYPYLLAGVFRIFGIYSRNSALVILSFNALCSALTCIPIFLMARRSFGRSVAVVACWIWALSPYSIYISGGFVWETCLSALLLAILFLWTLQLREHPGRWSWLGFGILWGVSALTNASTLALFPFLTGWALYPLRRTRVSRQQWLAATVLAVLGLAIAVLPWQVRNYRTFHTPITLRDNFWLEFWVGNDGHSESWMDENAHPSINEAELAEFVRRGEIPYMQEKRREALSYLAQHPGQFVALSFRRFLYMWTGFWNLAPENLEIEFHNPANAYLATGLTAAMLIGLWQALRNTRDATWPYVLVLVFYPLIFYVTHPAMRYRHMMEPEMVVLAAVGVRFLVLGAKGKIPLATERLHAA